MPYIRIRYLLEPNNPFEGLNAWECFNDIFCDILGDPSLQNAVFVVDALDECPESERNLLIDLILKSSRSFRAKWILSSRNWPTIEERLSVAGENRLSLNLDNEWTPQAVEVFIQHRVNYLARKMIYTPEITQAVLKQLRSKANDTFLWVELVCNELAKVNPQNTVATLESVPSGLEELQKHILDRVLSSKHGAICREIIAIIRIAYRPVTLEELRVLVTEVEYLSSHQWQELIEECGSFLAVYDGIAYLAHRSVRDFVDHDSQIFFPLGIADQHYRIFMGSLNSLMTLKHNLYNLDSPGILYKDITIPEPDPFSHLRYSSLYWLDHLEEARKTINSSDKLIIKFMRERFLDWLEFLSVQGKVPEGTKLVRKLQQIADKSTVQVFKDLVQDALKFIFHHGQVIEMSPLQTYASALIFSPTGSLIKQIYEKEQPDWVTLKPKMKPNWGACFQTLNVDKKDFMSVILSPNGRQLASSTDNGMIHIWDVKSGLQTQSFIVGVVGDFVEPLAFSIDSQELTVGGGQRGIQLWNLNSGSLVQVLLDVNCRGALALSSDGALLALRPSRRSTHDIEEQIEIWDMTKGDCIQTLAHSDLVYDVSFSEDGKKLASRAETEIKLWDLVTSMPIWTYSCDSCGSSSSSDTYGFSEEESILCHSFLGDGSLALGSSKGTIKILDASTGTCIKTLNAHRYNVSAIISLGSGRQIVSAGTTIKIWDDEGLCVQTLRGSLGDITILALSADKKVFVSVSIPACSGHRLVKAWDLTMQPGRRLIEGHRSGVDRVTFSPDGQWLASVSDDGAVKVWDTSTGTCVEAQGFLGVLTPTSFSPNSQQLLIYGRGQFVGQLKLWNLQKRDFVESFEDVRCHTFSPGGEQLAVFFADSTLTIWDIATRQTIHRIDRNAALNSKSCDSSPPSTVSKYRSNLAFTADGHNLALAFGNEVEIWDLSTGDCVETFIHDTRVLNIALAPNSQWLAVSHENGISVWNKSTHALHRKLSAAYNHALTWSPGSDYLAYSSFGTVRVWDIKTDTCIRRFELQSWAFFDPFRFDEANSDKLCTVFGELELEEPGGPSKTTKLGESSEVIRDKECVKMTRFCGYGLSQDGRWIMRGTEKMLCLPPEYYPKRAATLGSTIAIGCESGHVLLMRFR
ncbi:quinon protein alcohol dehydrogenase-like superfamily [Thelonectria olida]|uniref:Quinon protein alcohol dehydrogenase-like superfamily n=1 Tax=Thelonectria olida TaxID=1576542 RepID=A0A9P8VNQ1_9HYPO|nr:quinon protein alcohol dehydrogenase-like superfamily [Thelonectria olida]